MGSVKTSDQRSSKGIVENDRPTTVKGHSRKPSINNCKIASLETIFQRWKKRLLNNLQQGYLKTLVQRSYEGILDNDSF